MKGRKWFGKGKENGEYIREVTLSTMELGCLVDYDLQTWEVTGISTYDFDGFLTREWELSNGTEVRFLERVEEDGKVEWTLTRKIQINQIEENIIDIIVEFDDPPEEIHYQERLYKAVESSAGILRDADEDEGGREFVNWSYEEDGDRVLFITQWGERDFMACEGTYVEEYQFTDILPGSQQ